MSPLLTLLLLGFYVSVGGICLAATRRPRPRQPDLRTLREQVDAAVPHERELLSVYT